VEGAGLVFTGTQVHLVRQRYEERVRGFVDLRPQFRLNSEVHGYTRDGIEVVTNVFAVFSIGELPEILRVTYVGEEIAENLRVVQLNAEKDPQNPRRRIQLVSSLVDELDPDDKQEIHAYLSNCSGMARPLRQVRRQSRNSPFVLDPERAFKAVVSEAIDEPQNTTIGWNELPVMAATEVFRNLLARNAYDQLYQPLSNDPSVYPIQNLQANVSAQVRNLGVLAVQYVRSKNRQPLQEGQRWVENELVLLPAIELRNTKLLRDRGIRVRLAGFTELVPNDEVRRQFLENWASRQQSEAEIILADHELQAMRIRNRARAMAQRDMVFTFSQILNTGKLSQEALTLRIFQELENLATDPGTRQLLPGETLEMLRALRFWFFPDSRGVLPMT
jgi:hypothetical protein